MTRPTIPAMLAASLTLVACAPWRTTEPVQPTTYTLPAYRERNAVGNLHRIAVLPVDIYGVWGLHAWDPRWTAATASGAAADGIAGILTAEKGYLARAVTLDADGHWQSDRLAPSPPDTWEDLQAEWRSARSDDAVGKAAARIGRSLRVDGVMTAWWCRFTPDPPLAAGFINLLLLDLPLFYGLGSTCAEAVLYATASGQPVWSQQMPGADMPTNGSSPAMDRLLGNLDNSIPAELAQ